MPTHPKLADAKHILVVEGYSDLLFFAEVLECLGKQGAVHIKELNGRGDFEAKLEDFVNPMLLAEKESIGVIMDADSNAATAASSLARLLSKLTGQTVIAGQWTSGKPRIGCFIAPDGASNGEIETLVWRAWADDPRNAEARKCIEVYRDCMQGHGFKPQSPDKGLISSLLAIRNDDDPRLGPGARTRKIFDFSRAEYKSLKEFLSAI